MLKQSSCRGAIAVSRDVSLRVSSLIGQRLSPVTQLATTAGGLLHLREALIDVRGSRRLARAQAFRVNISDR